METVAFDTSYRLDLEGYTRKRPRIKIDRYQFADRKYLLLDDEMRFSAYVRIPDTPEAGLERRETLSRRFLLTVTREPVFEGPALDLTVPINDLYSRLRGERFDIRQASEPVAVDIAFVAVQNPAGDPVFHDEAGEPISEIGYTNAGTFEWPETTPFDTDWRPNSGEAFGVRRLGRVEVDPAELRGEDPTD